MELRPMRYRDVISRADVTPEILEYVEHEADIAYPYPSPIDWDDLLYRTDGDDLGTGPIDWGPRNDSPAIRYLRREINRRRRTG